MINIEIDTGALDALQRGWSAGHARALKTAFRAEAFRLKKAADHAIVADRLGFADAAPLTEAQRKHPGVAPLAALAGGGGRRSFIGYEVTDDGATPEARIGFGRAVTRARDSAGRRRQLVALFGGGTHTITRADQRRITSKARRRLGEPVQRPRRGRPDRKPRRPARAQWQRILLPPVGSVVRWPARDFVAAVVAREHDNTAHNIRRLYETKLAGERFARRWWNKQGRF